LNNQQNIPNEQEENLPLNKQCSWCDPLDNNCRYFVKNKCYCRKYNIKLEV